LFQPLPANRTCRDAGIKASHCSCAEEKLVGSAIKVPHERHPELVRPLIQFLNMKNSGGGECRPLTLHAVKSASVRHVNLTVENKHWFEYRVTLNVNEGRAPLFAGGPPIRTEFEFLTNSGCRYELPEILCGKLAIESAVQLTRWAQNRRCAPKGADPRFCVCQPDDYIPPHGPLKVKFRPLWHY
jgi:hypothetical protein